MPFSIGCQINLGISTTRGSLRNSFRYLRTGPVLGSSGVPSCANIIALMGAELCMTSLSVCAVYFMLVYSLVNYQRTVILISPLTIFSVTVYPWVLRKSPASLPTPAEGTSKMILLAPTNAEDCMLSSTPL